MAGSRQHVRASIFLLQSVHRVWILRQAMLRVYIFLFFIFFFVHSLQTSPSSETDRLAPRVHSAHQLEVVRIEVVHPDEALLASAHIPVQTHAATEHV